MKNVKGIFNDGDYCTTTDSKNFVIGKINPCTARGKVGGSALLDGNYTNDTGFPSVTSQRIHDGLVYQDFSYKIKVGKSINDYRSIVKSLLSPAGTIFFGEVSIRQLVDGSAEAYNVNFDGLKTTRSFIPTLIIGSREDPADIELEIGTVPAEAPVFTSQTGRLSLETEEGILTTERFLAIDASTIRDQASGQAYIVGESFTLVDKDFFERQLVAEVGVKGHRVDKELLIFPAYNQHKISYTTLGNALAVGTKVVGATSKSLGVVMQHDTTNKFIIVHRDLEDQGDQSTNFTTEVIQNTAASTNYFTSTAVELHWTPEDIVGKQVPTAITKDSFMISEAQKTATEGGGDSYAHADYLGNLGFHGRGKVLTANDRSETYDSELRQRKVNIISSPLFTQAATQRGRTYSAGVKQTRTLNTQNTRTEGSNTTANNSNGTALRIDDRFNQITLAGNSFGHRPAGQRLFETTNFLSEQIVSESQEPIIYEPYSGRILGEEFTQGGIILLEDGEQILWEDATVNDETIYFVSEQTSQIGSFNLIDESGNRLIDETNSKPLLQEQALMNGEKESNQSGPSIGDLRDMMFTENYKLMAKIQLDSGSGISSGDDLLLETGEHMLQESPFEGLRISDISTIYPRGFVSNFENVLGRKTNLNHSAVVQTG